MKVRFSVVVFDTPDTRVGIVGSLPSLGSWDVASCTPLQPLDIPQSELIPNTFTTVIDLPEVTFPARTVDSSGVDVVTPPTTSTAPSSPTAASPLQSVSSFEYKYVIWKDEIHSSSLPRARDNDLSSQDFSSHLSPHGYLFTASDFRMPSALSNLPPLIQARYQSPPLPHQTIIWEGNGSSHNRLVEVPEVEEAASSSSMMNAFTGTTHTMSRDFLMSDQNAPLYALPPTHFLVPQFWDVGIGRCEQIHTHRYYCNLQRTREFHFNKIAPRIFVGSCPRRLHHLTTLHDRYRVGTIFNFQTVEDIRINWVDDEGFPDIETRTPENLRGTYLSVGLQHVWMPTTDMSTPARAAMMAQAAWLVAGVLVANPDKNIYIHCNAGVGRAIACVSAFLHFCIGLTEMETALLVTMRRPVAFFDWVALRAGKKDFDLKYARALACLPVIENDVSALTAKKPVESKKS